MVHIGQHDGLEDCHIDSCESSGSQTAEDDTGLQVTCFLLCSLAGNDLSVYYIVMFSIVCPVRGKGILILYAMQQPPTERQPPNKGYTTKGKRE